MLSDILSLFVIGTLSFYVLLVLLSAFIIWMVEQEHSGRAMFALIVGIVIVKYANHLDILTSLKDNYIWWIVGFFAHFIIGGIWSIFKWMLYTKRAHDRYKKVKEAFLESKKITNINNDERRREWTVFYRGRYGDESPIPEAKHNKERITTWIIYWEFSLLWFLLHDPITRLSRFVYDSFVSTYNRITEKHVDAVNQDFLKETSETPETSVKQG